MKKYLAVLKQWGEGCDYTIGCGNTTSIVSGENFKDAFNNLAKDWGWIADDPKDYYFSTYDDDGEMELESVALYEIADEDSGHTFINWKNEYQQQEKERKILQAKKKEEEEFQRLARKLGKTVVLNII